LSVRPVLAACRADGDAAAREMIRGGKGLSVRPVLAVCRADGDAAAREMIRGGKELLLSIRTSQA